MGNPAWGHGYHQGSADGFRSGFGQGSAVGAAVTLVIGGALWGFDKLKKIRIAKHEQALLAEVDRLEDANDEGSEGNRSD